MIPLCVFPVVVDFPAGTNDVRRRRPLTTPLSFIHTRRATRPRATTTHARLLSQQAWRLIPLRSPGESASGASGPTPALRFRCHGPPLPPVFDQKTECHVAM